VALRRLLPHPGETTVDELLDTLDLAALAPPDRPYVVVNMVASVDGRAAIGGLSGKLSAPADREMFHGLRGRVDAVMAGTGTLRAERYRRMIFTPERRAARETRGLPPEPVSVVLSRTGDFPTDIPLFSDPEARLALYEGEDAVSPERALRRLRSEHGVRSVLCEGGPTLNAALLRDGVVDELFLSVSPQIVADGEALGITARAGLEEPVPLELVWLLEEDGMLFLRYRVTRERG
jgi:riboflavin biosynthesis pyrimidine reductase